MEPNKKLLAKLAEVLAEVGYVEKRGYNDFHKYKYVTEADLVEEVRGKLASRQVMLMPEAVGRWQDGTVTTVEMRFTFLDAATGESLSFGWFGAGDDKGDKGIYKAYTGALKYFLMKTFLIPTGDDPEADTATDARNAGPEPVRRPQDGSQGIPERYVDCLRMAIRHHDPDELADEDAWAQLVGTATTSEEKIKLVDELEAALTDLGGDPGKVRERWEAARRVPA